jgi:hypothetical protein
MTLTPQAVSDVAAAAELGWIAREANALIAEHVGTNTERYMQYRARKRALMRYVQTRREA